MAQPVASPSSAPVVLEGSQLKGPLGFQVEQIFAGAIFAVSFPVANRRSNTAAELEPKSGDQSRVRHPAVITAVLGRATYVV